MPKGQLNNRVALVTGAGRGIGRAIALGFAGEGAAIAAVARTESELASLETEVRALGAKVVSIPADLADRAAPAKVVEQTIQALGSVDVLVNNAGVGTYTSARPIAEFDDDFWDLSLALNLTTPYLFIKALLPVFLAKKRGRVLNIASVASKTAIMHGVAYAASKHGLLGLTRTLALEYAKDGITANAICPGPVRTLMNDGRMRYDAERLGTTVKELESRITPIGRRLEPEEMVPLAILLASDSSAAITGQAFNVCGGLLMV
jgi:3-oxoacyl-[acyl-carrier protein] reductase